jgi:hypothetical protein
MIGIGCTAFTMTECNEVMSCAVWNAFSVLWRLPVLPSSGTDMMSGVSLKQLSADSH